MKKLIPILLTIFMLMGTPVALGATSTQLSGIGVVKPNAYQTISGGKYLVFQEDITTEYLHNTHHWMVV
ncbi:hypothetical protein [Desulfosporosinus metallidurans]|uniref:Uncharacterized protein n=1 Tax=Desulfosporosinus metallidurans TaxID=1888891 RepID=A0A1Q8QYG5_9FIRM|nr:hypothetical protein [Desulfosporosinus metallidurans]OLN32377.1 hypothetical protein DSOL_1697 [Desulfosporosinus metallidurans]